MFCKYEPRIALITIAVVDDDDDDDDNDCNDEIIPLPGQFMLQPSPLK